MENQQTNQSSSRALSSDKRLTLKQQRFVDAYIQSGGDGAQAVIAAGYKTKSRQSMHTIACENLKKPLIRLELERQGYKDCGLIHSDAIVEIIGSVQGKKEQPSLLAFLRILLKSLEQGLKLQIC